MFFIKPGGSNLGFFVEKAKSARHDRKVPGINDEKGRKRLKKDNKMPRLPRVQIEGALYYVTCQGNQRGRIFLSEEDYRGFMDILSKYKEQYRFKLYAYALLPDHFHLLMELPAPKEEGVSPISEAMRDINSSYTKYFNRAHARTGHLFKQRYKSALVEKEQYLFMTTVYIHQNPKRIKLIDSPTAYPYTSCSFYSGGPDYSLGLMEEEKKEAEMFLGGRIYSQAAESFSSAESLNLHKRLQKKCMLGSKAFEGRVKQAIEAVSGTPVAVEKTKKTVFAWRGLMAGIALVALMIGAYAVIKILPPATVSNSGESSVFAEYNLPEQLQDIMKRLEGAEWQIRIVPVSGGRVQMDAIEFYDGVFSSDNLVFRGYFPVEYSLVVDDAGGVVYTARMRRGHDIAAWYGEISDIGEMRGTLTIRQKGLENRDFSFVSVSYSGKEVWRKLIEPKIRQ